MSSDTCVVTILGIKGKVARLRVRGVEFPPGNGYSASRSFALLLLADASRVRSRPLAVELARASKVEPNWRSSQVFMRDHVGEYIARTRIAERVNVAPETALARNARVEIQERVEDEPASRREEVLAKSHHHIVLEVTVTDARWLAGLEVGAISGSTAYDVWLADPLRPKAPAGKPWKPPATKPSRPPVDGFIDKAFVTALVSEQHDAAVARIGTSVHPEKTYEFESSYSTALIVAALHGSGKVVDLLLAKGADPNLADGNGLLATFRTRVPAIFERLLEAGADPNHADKSGNTVLHYQAMFDPDSPAKIRMAELALAHGANGRIENKRGETALELALANDGAVIAAAIQAAHPDPAGAAPVRRSKAKPAARTVKKPAKAKRAARRSRS